MTDLERLRGSAARPLPPRGGAAAARETARRRLARIATVASSGLVVVAVLATRAGSGGANGLDVVAPPPAATASAAPTTTPVASPASDPPGSHAPGVAPTATTSPVPSVETTADPVVPTTGPPSSASPASGRPRKLGDGENMPREMVNRGAGACTSTQERSQTFCGAVTAAVGADRVVTITTEVCAAGVNTGAEVLTYVAELETDVVVRDGSTQLWRWSSGKSWESTPHTLPIDAGQCYVWTATWQPVDGDGAPLPAGTYDVMALSTADEVGSANTWSDTIVLP